MSFYKSFKLPFTKIRINVVVNYLTDNIVIKRFHTYVNGSEMWREYQMRVTGITFKNNFLGFAVRDSSKYKETLRYDQEETL